MRHAKHNFKCVSETGRHEMCDSCDLCIMRHRKATLAGGFKDTFVSPDKFLLSEYILSTETPSFLSPDYDKLFFIIVRSLIYYVDSIKMKSFLFSF